MLFNSVEFIFYFLPLTLLVFYFIPAKFKLASIPVASVIFYAQEGVVAASLLVGTMLIAYFAALKFNTSNRKLWFLVAVSVPLFILFVSKYLSFFLTTFGISSEDISWASNLALPAGISFYTFQIVSYLIDTYRKKQKAEGNLFLLAAFFSFFPQLIAGPILRFSDLQGQLKKISLKNHTPYLAEGCKLFSIGLFGKVFFSDFLHFFFEKYERIPSNSATDALYPVLSYSFIIYYDFWSYSLMAMGLACFFGIRIPKNFNEPYHSSNPKEFWRRWHISLSSWLKDYVYIPLGGRDQYVRNTIIVFLACGLWHGAGWNFVVWGAYHATLILLYHIFGRYFDKIPNPIQIAITFLAVSLGWPLFYLDINGYIILMWKIFWHGQLTPEVYFFSDWIILFLIGAWTFLFREKMWLYNDSSVKKGLIDSPYIQGILFVSAILFVSLGRTFIYFRF